MQKLSRTDREWIAKERKRNKQAQLAQALAQARIERGRTRIDAVVVRLMRIVGPQYVHNPALLYHIYVAQPIDGNLSRAPIVAESNPDPSLYTDLGLLTHHALILDTEAELRRVLSAGWAVYF